MTARRPVPADLGFTLLELGVVLAVISIMAVTVLADVIEIFKNRGAEGDAEQLYFIQQAAKGYFRSTVISADGTIDPLDAHWPGEVDPETCDTGSKAQPGKTNAILVDLKAPQVPGKPETAFLPAGFVAKNIWNQPYTFDLVPTYAKKIPDPGAVFLCAFKMTTDVPIEVQGVITTYLPLATCVAATCGNDPPVAAGFIRCCSQTPKPGVEASMAEAKAYFDQVIDQSGHHSGGGGRHHRH